MKSRLVALAHSDREPDVKGFYFFKVCIYIKLSAKSSFKSHLCVVRVDELGRLCSWNGYSFPLFQALLLSRPSVISLETMLSLTISLCFVLKRYAPLSATHSVSAMCLETLESTEIKTCHTCQSPI